jgi:hypothetical protein
MRIALTPSLLIVLGGCAANLPPPSPGVIQEPTEVSAPPETGPPPLTAQAARTALLAEKRRLWKDPDSIRDAAISPPHYCPTQPSSVCVCVEANSRNGAGGFTGIITSIFIFEGTKIVDGVEGVYAPARAKCGPFQPFPALNGKR